MWSLPNFIIWAIARSSKVQGAEVLNSKRMFPPVRVNMLYISTWLYTTNTTDTSYEALFHGVLSRVSEYLRDYCCGEQC